MAGAIQGVEAHSTPAGQGSVPKTLLPAADQRCALVNLPSHLCHNGVVVGGGAHVRRKVPLLGDECAARRDIGDKQTPQPFAITGVLHVTGGSVSA